MTVPVRVITYRSLFAENIQWFANKGTGVKKEKKERKKVEKVKNVKQNKSNLYFRQKVYVYLYVYLYYL